MMRTVLEIIGAIVALVVVIIGGYMFIENRYALKNQLEKIEIRLEMKIVSDNIHQIQNRVWDIQDRLSENPGDKTAKEEVRELKEKKKNFENELNVLRQSIRTMKE